MKRRILIIACLLIVGGSFLLWEKKETKRPINDRSASEAAGQSESAVATQPESVSDINDSRLNRLKDGRVEYLPALRLSSEISKDLRPDERAAAISQILQHYRYAYQVNPVGTENSEITKQLLGDNPKRIVFIDADSEVLSGNELIDEWNTPYFFHALSASEMEVLSAGPDRVFWSNDDILNSDASGQDANSLSL